MLTRPKDVGRPKADVAADFINSRIPGCCVVPYPLDHKTLCVSGLKKDHYNILDARLKHIY